MAKTRTQTGTIEIPKYDRATLQLKGESRSPTSPPKPGPKKPRPGKKTGVKQAGGRKLGNGPQKRRSRSRGKDPEISGSPLRDVKLEEPSQPAFKSPYDDSTTFWPPVAFGEHEKDGLSPIARADLRISQWQAILDSHMANMPGPVLQHIKVQLHHAQMYRESLDADPANHNAVDETKRAEAIEDRISALKTALASAQFEPEKENIRGAIAAYRSGQIGYSKKYTLIWAGKKVDEAETYAEFTHDRMERLDRYAAEHGPHWLWWESPLWIHPDLRVAAMGCQIAPREAQVHGFGSFWIKQGYWKRSHMVHRMPESSFQGGVHVPSADEDNFIATPDGKVYCYEPGPRLIFRSVLDSGAAFPALYEQDLWALGIFPSHYGAQSVIRVFTANGVAFRRVYEMHVEIAGNQGTDMIDPSNPVNPAYPRHIGGLCPVVIDETDGQKGPGIDAEGNEINGRLSGMMPFLAAYTSTTPGRNMILFGENRNDVLGAHKTPAARRWMVGFDQDPDDISHWDRFQNPMITFNHRNGAIVDEDIGPAVSKLTVYPGQGIRERSILTDPRGEYWRHGNISNAGVIDPTESHT